MPFRIVAENTEQTLQALRDVQAQTVETRILTIANGPHRLGRPHKAGWLEWHYALPLPLAAVWNRALQFAWAAGATEAWVINNDVRVPPWLLAELQAVQRVTGAWFLTATNVGERYETALTEAVVIDETFRASRGGPDFSCFLIQRECHQWFQFDEGFQPAYHEDNDYHRRLELAGFGDRIFSVCLPYLHYGSGTLKADAQLRATWDQRFAQSQQWYVDKWGGLPGHETYDQPFGHPLRNMLLDDRCTLFDQGRIQSLDRLRAIHTAWYHEDDPEDLGAPEDQDGQEA